MSIYKYRQYHKPNILQKLFKLTPKENALVAVNNLLEQYQDNITQLSLDEVMAVADDYKVNLRNKFTGERKELFRFYLEHCLQDEALSEQEMAELAHLRKLLFLSQREVNTLVEEAGRPIYNRRVKDNIADGRLSDKEEQNLDRLKKSLLLPDRVAENIYAKHAREYLQAYMDEATADNLLSEAEDEEMEAIAESLGIEIQLNEKSRSALNKMRLFWQIENGELPTLEPDINLYKTEKLYFKTVVNWYEHRRVTRSYNYGGLSARIKIAKGLYYRTGNIGVQKVSDDVLKYIDTGRLYLTNKRIIFMGSRGNKRIRLNRILEVNPFQNGVDVQKDAGKSPFLEFEERVDVFAMVLIRAMDEY